MSKSISILQQVAARNVVTKCLNVRPGESVVVEAWTHTLPTSTAIVDEVRRAGGVPLLLLEDETAYWNAFDRGQTKLLGTMSASEVAALRAADVFVMFWGPGDSGRFENLDEKTSDEVTAWNDPWYEIARKSGLRGVRMGIGMVTESNAKSWKTSLDRLTREVLEATSVDPRRMMKDGARLQKVLRGRRRVRIQHSNGTDLEVALAARPSTLYTGIPGRFAKRSPFGMLSGCPDGRLPIALDGEIAEGTIIANRPTWTPWWVNDGGRYQFHHGRLTNYSFHMGGQKFRERFGRGTAGKDRPGALQFGLNPMLKHVPTMHTSEYGVVSLQIGRNTGFGGTNTSSFLDWVSLGGADVFVDEWPIIKAGRIL